MPDRLVWCDPPDQWELRPDTAHVWVVDIDQEGAHWQRDLPLLSENERQQGLRFIQPIHRQHYIAAHASLRKILSFYLDQPPELLEFSATAQGKPVIAAVDNSQGIHFNLSHSGGWALCAISRDREVGVDIEVHKPRLDGLALAERFFAPAEVALLKSCSAAELEDHFYRCWTRKEAFLKAIGLGLRHALDQFSVNVGESFTETATLTYDDKQWCVYTLPPILKNAEAALAVEGCVKHTQCWKYSG